MYKDPKDPRQKESARRYYEKNKADYLRRSTEQRQRLYEYVNEVKSKPCMDCNNVFPPCVMDFDHRDPTQKIKGGVSKLITNGNLQKIIEEIAKCDLVCANCHRIRTHMK